MQIPKHLLYTKEHEWLELSGDTAKIGITHHAQDQLGDVVYIDLPDIGTRVTSGTVLGTIESVKAVSDLFAPIGGEVIEINPVLRDHPEAINSDPYGQAWMVKLRLQDQSELAQLLTSEAYTEWLAR